MRALYQLSYLMSKKQDVQDLKLDLIIRHLNVGSGEVQALEKAKKDIMASGPSRIKRGVASAEIERVLECGWVDQSRIKQGVASAEIEHVLECGWVDQSVWKCLSAQARETEATHV